MGDRRVLDEPRREGGPPDADRRPRRRGRRPRPCRSLLLTGAVVMRSTGKRGVARSLELIEQVHVRHEVAKQDLPLRERLVDPAVHGRPAARPAAHPGRRPGQPAAPARHRRQPDRLDAGADPRHEGDRACSSASLLGVLMLLRLGLPAGLLWVAGLGAVGLLAAGPAALQRGRQAPADAAARASRRARHADRLRRGRPRLRRRAVPGRRATPTGPIAGEFARILQEMQIGKTRVEAFQALARAHHRSGANMLRLRSRAGRQPRHPGRQTCCAVSRTRCGSSGASGPRSRPRRSR